MRGILEAWKQPIYYDYDKNMTMDLLSSIIEDVGKTGFPIYAITGDLRAENRALLKSLEISPEKTSFNNPFDPKRRIFVFADIPHMLKLIRHHLIDD